MNGREKCGDPEHGDMENGDFPQYKTFLYKKNGIKNIFLNQERIRFPNFFSLIISISGFSQKVNSAVSVRQILCVTLYIKK